MTRINANAEKLSPEKFGHITTAITSTTSNWPFGSFNINFSFYSQGHTLHFPQESMECTPCLSDGWMHWCSLNNSNTSASYIFIIRTQFALDTATQVLAWAFLCYSHYVSLEIQRYQFFFTTSLWGIGKHIFPMKELRIKAK